jgi:cytochrome c oxidase subunit 4
MSDPSHTAHGPVVTPTGGHAGHGDDLHDAHEGHVSGVGKYIVVFICLCLLTTASFFTYSDWWREHFSPQVGWAFMMAVSCTKAMLVILFFMHVLYEANWKFVLTIPAALMSIFLILMLVPDVGMRGRWASDDRKFHMAEETTGEPAPKEPWPYTHTPHETKGGESKP